MRMIYNWLPLKKRHPRIDQYSIIETLITALNATIILVIWFHSSSDHGIEVISDWCVLAWSIALQVIGVWIFLSTCFGHVFKIDYISFVFPLALWKPPKVQGTVSIFVTLLSEEVWIQCIFKRKVGGVGGRQAGRQT